MSLWEIHCLVHNTILCFSCLFDGDECTEEFKTNVIADIDSGPCISFNLKTERKVTHAGPNHGLSLLVNTENYEKFVGHTRETGVKVINSDIDLILYCL